MSLAVFMLSAPARALEAVDLELLLLVDVSRSVDANEYILQRDGYADAFRDPAFYSGYIASGRYRRIAVSLVLLVFAQLKAGRRTLDAGR